MLMDGLTPRPDAFELIDELLDLPPAIVGEFGVGLMRMEGPRAIAGDERGSASMNWLEDGEAFGDEEKVDERVEVKDAPRLRAARTSAESRGPLWTGDAEGC